MQHALLKVFFLVKDRKGASLSNKHFVSKMDRNQLVCKGATKAYGSENALR